MATTLGLTTVTQQSLASSYLTNVTGNGLTVTTVADTSERDLNALLKKVFDISLIVAVSFTMLCLGCTIEWKILKSHLRRPTGIIIGLVCQFIVFPAVAFGLAHALQLSKWNAVGMILLGTSPGGTSSNIFTLYCQGDIPLSVTMTTISTVVGIGMMPLNAWIYSRSWVDHKTTVPIANIMIGLASMLIPVAIGMVIKIKLPKVAKVLPTIGAVVGMLMLLGVIAIGSYLYPEIYTSSWRIWVAACLLPIIGLAIGFAAASIFRMPQASRRAVAIEIGCQNAGLCITIIAISYDVDVFLHVAVYAELFTVCGWPIIFACVGFYHLHKCMYGENKEHDKVELKCYEKKTTEDNESAYEKKIVEVLKY